MAYIYIYICVGLSATPLWQLVYEKQAGLEGLPRWCSQKESGISQKKYLKLTPLWQLVYEKQAGLEGLPRWCSQKESGISQKKYLKLYFLTCGQMLFPASILVKVSSRSKTLLKHVFSFRLLIESSRKHLQKFA